MTDSEPEGGRRNKENARWKLRAFHTKPTIAVIEPGDAAQNTSGVPFGFGRVLEPDVGEDAWEGMGL